MAVSKKGRRKVRFKGRNFIWYVNETAEQVPDQGFIEYEKRRHIHIISFDKQFIVHYRCPRAEETASQLRVEGPEFPRRPGARLVTVPRWRRDMKFPSADFVRRLIEWCMAAQVVEEE